MIPNLDRIFGSPAIKAGFQVKFPDEAFNKILEQIHVFVKNAIQKENPKEFPPGIVMVTCGPVEGSFVVGMAPIPVINDDRHEHLCIMGRLAFENHMALCGAFIVSEAWMCATPEDSKQYMERKDKSQRICDLPPEKRREILSIGGFTVDGRSNAITLGIKRDEEGNIVDCSEVVFNSPYRDDSGGEDTRVYSGLPASFVTGWVCGLLVASGLSSEPMGELLKAANINLEDYRVGEQGCDGECGEDCDCGHGQKGGPEPWASDPDGWKKGKKKG